MAAKAFIQALPKAELHVHLEGTVDPAMLAELSRRNNTPLPTENNRYDVRGSGDLLTEDDVRRLYAYQDFPGFLLAFKSVTERLRSPEDYELVTYRLMQKLKQQNVMHAEVYVSVGVVRWRGQEFAPIFEGMERGRERGQRDFGVSLLWIFDAVRHFGPTQRLKSLIWRRNCASATSSASAWAETNSAAPPMVQRSLQKGRRPRSSAHGARRRIGKRRVRLGRAQYWRGENRPRTGDCQRS